jgi:hypothetical protein
MEWSEAFTRIQQIQGLLLQSISGKTDIQLISIDAIEYVVRRQDGVLKSRNTSELSDLVDLLILNHPIHVDRALHGSNSSRSHPETTLANLPDVEWRRINRRKHILWVGHETHQPGSLREG